MGKVLPHRIDGTCCSENVLFLRLISACFGLQAAGDGRGGGKRADVSSEVGGRGGKTRSRMAAGVRVCRAI
eukprot:2646445-Rhodomonas_salina.1